jgi:hypothetical protein
VRPHSNPTDSGGIVPIPRVRTVPIPLPSPELREALGTGTVPPVGSRGGGNAVFVRAFRRVVFPPSPWRLRGRAVVSLWRSPATAEPNAVRLFGRSVVGVARVTYDEGGDLAYDELALFALVRTPKGLGVTIRAIWVDSEASLEGGRALWAIPKERGEFVGETIRRPDGEPLAAVRFRPEIGLPGLWRLRGWIEQGEVLTPVRLRTRFRLGSVGWAFPAGSAFPSGRPFLTVRLDAPEMTFGAVSALDR